MPLGDNDDDDEGVRTGRRKRRRRRRKKRRKKTPTTTTTTSIGGGFRSSILDRIRALLRGKEVEWDSAAKCDECDELRGSWQRLRRMMTARFPFQFARPFPVLALDLHHVYVKLCCEINVATIGCKAGRVTSIARQNNIENFEDDLKASKKTSRRGNSWS